jgi:uncharacterized membrane protein YccC
MTSSSPPANPHSSTLARAAREAVRFDRQAMSVQAGLLAAVPVVAVLGGGIAAGDPVPAVSMGAGAMLVGIAWRTQGGRPPLAVMTTDALIMALSTFVGCVTGSIVWLHLVILCLWSLVGGLLVSAGNRGGVIGTQAIISAVVFGRFNQPPAQALGLASLVLAGGLAQVIFLSVVRWPTPLRGKRLATAAAYRSLAALAGAQAGVSSLPAASALDEAEASLASPALFGDSAIMTLRSLVNEGHRLRVGLSALHGLIRQAGDAQGGSALSVAQREAVARAQTLIGAVLELAAAAIEKGSGAMAGARPALQELNSVVERFPVAGQETAASAPSNSQPVIVRRRLAALAGQARAVASLAGAAAEGGGLRSRRPHRRTNRPLQRLLSDLAHVRANADLGSPAGRHALRLAVVVVGVELLARQLPLERSYWVVVAAATALRPEFSATFTRGVERALGTCLGVGLAGAIAVGLHPAGGATVVLVGALAWSAYAVFPASFALGFAFITALVVFLLNAISPDTLATASARLVDTGVGGAIGLLAYTLWPTWARGSARGSLADLVAAQRAYLDAVLLSIGEGRQADEQQMRTLARRARLARTTAEAAVGRSLAEPRTRQIDPELGQSGLAVMRRLVQAAHVLRLDALQDGDRPARQGLEGFRRDLDAVLETVHQRLARPDAAGPRSPLPDLRRSYDRFADGSGRDEDTRALLAELDEIVDAANSLADLAGLGESDRRSIGDDPQGRYALVS